MEVSVYVVSQAQPLKVRTRDTQVLRASAPDLSEHVDVGLGFGLSGTPVTCVVASSLGPGRAWALVDWAVGPSASVGSERGESWHPVSRTGRVRRAQAARTGVRREAGCDIERP